jgi:hypothetical protein
VVPRFPTDPSAPTAIPGLARSVDRVQGNHNARYNAWEIFSDHWPTGTGVMTAQVSESITLEGEERALCSLPLAPLFRSWQPQPRFGSWNTANWRGYQGSWEIGASKLYLVGFSGFPATNNEMCTDDMPWKLKYQREARDRCGGILAEIKKLPKDHDGFLICPDLRSPVGDEDGFLSSDYTGGIDLETVLYASRSPVFAEWYSGLLRIPDGSMIKYVHGGFESVNERELILSVESGFVTERWTLNYVPTFSAETYSLVAMRPRLKPDAEKFASKFLANPFSTDRMEIASAIFAPEEPILLFGVSDLVEVLLRADLLREAGRCEVLSRKDRLARRKFNKKIEAFRKSAADVGCAILEEYFKENEFSDDDTEIGKAILHAAKVPQKRKNALEWAVTAMRDISKHLAEGNISKLAIAAELIQSQIVYG